MADAEKPLFSPLYLQSSTGQGKTHLMHAIGHAYRAAFPEARIIYMSAERFMIEFVSAMRRNEAMEFKGALREADLLMIDASLYTGPIPTTVAEAFQAITDITEVIDGNAVIDFGGGNTLTLIGIDDESDVLPSQFDFFI